MDPQSIQNRTPGQLVASADATGRAGDGQHSVLERATTARALPGAVLVTTRTIKAASLFCYAFLLIIPFTSFDFYLYFRFHEVRSDATPYQAFAVATLLHVLAAYCMGSNRKNFSAGVEARLRTLRVFRVALWFAGIAGAAVTAFCALLLPRLGGYSWVGYVGMALLVGKLCTIPCILVPHELIHSVHRSERVLGGVLLCFVMFPSFKIEHVRGHHVDVATPRDPSSAERGESIYRFLVRAMTQNYVKAWRLENERLRNFSKRWPQHEMIWWSALQASVAAFLAWAGGWQSVVFLALVSFTAVVHLEAVNYVQHYGLRRDALGGGGFERVTTLHSWNTPAWRDQFWMVNVGRHADHHRAPGRPYQVLRYDPRSPELPIPLSLAIYLAFLPPLWRALVDPLVDSHGANGCGSPAPRGAQG